MRQAATIVAGAVLAMQLVLAAQACVLPLSASPTPMVAAQCEGSGANSTSCLIQCHKTADQIKPSADFHLDALPTANAWVRVLFAWAIRHWVETPMGHPSVGPPLQVLFCSFQC